MSGWDWDSFDEIINHGHFRIVHPGPLRAPIRAFTLRRNDKLELILETRTSDDAKSASPVFPPGTVRINTDTVTLTNSAGVDAVAGGVQPLRYASSRNYERDTREFTETARVHYVEAKLPNAKPAKYTIDWLENVNGRNFVWPHAIKYETSTTKTRTINPDDNGITLSSNDGHEGFNRTSVKFAVAGMDVYLCASWQEPSEGRVHPGCLIYIGTPDEITRTKIRNAISFSLGLYLVHLGSNTFCENWGTVSFKSISAYSIDRKVFDLVVQPPAPLGSRYQGEIDPSALSRMVNSIYASYDDLKFGDLSWAYWHALCATVHIAPVHFGAAIEALQRRYFERYPERFQAKAVTDKAVWNALADEVRGAISKLDIADKNKETLFANVGGLNQTPRRVMTERLLEHINIQLGVDEAQAWKRRNDAAHGNDMKDGAELDVIRDTKLLRVLFHRIFLRVTNACDSYYDYCTLDFPVRNLGDPVPRAHS